ncbi:PPC domain-containing DNA-binding protein [Bdellovibrio sp. ArHS]|uniref:PPC domain-containing DNA-binding protein n=1 Tax=Bdellovibrio sp. ArHS TaxID=1569284 RepID=UPI000B0DE3E9|nr:PPC domain-containing DNA-binding protein [Bdellovibrio sp. ArHS]
MFEIAQTETSKRYIKVSGGYLMVLRQGDPLFPYLESLAKKENIKSATFSGYGPANVKFGFSDKSTQEMPAKEFKNIVLVNFNGSMAWDDGNPSMRAYGVAAAENGQIIGGQVLEAIVEGGSFEIRIELMDKKLNRIHDESLKAKIMEIR